MAKQKPGKRPYARETPFTLEACNAISHYSFTIEELKKEREEAFEARDNAIAQLDGIADKESEEAHDAEIEHSKAVRAIDNIAASIKFYQSELQGAIRKAVKDEDKVEIYDFNAEAAKKPKEKGEPGEIPGQMKLVGGAAVDDRPVGRPFAVGGGPGKKPAAIEPMPADGKDEQLQASVKELGGEGKDQLSDATIAALIAGGYQTVRDIAKVLDGKDGRTKLGNDIAKGEKVVAGIVKATELFRAKHRKAILNAQHEALKADALKAQA